MGTVSVVVVTRNRAGSLLQTLARLEALPERPPVIVVDNASVDGTVAAVRARHPRVRVLALPGNAGAAGRNLGVRVAPTAYVAFCDDDSWWAPGALAAAAARLDADRTLAGVAARVLVGPEGRLDPVSAAMAASPLGADLAPRPEGERGVTGFSACGLVVRRTALLAVGGFEGRLLIGGEEEPVALRLLAGGWRLLYAPEVVAHHHPSPARDPAARAAQVAAHAVVVGWWLLGVRTALRRSLRLLARAAPRRALWSALSRAAAGAPWALGDRRPVPGPVEAALLVTSFVDAPRGGRRRSARTQATAEAQCGGDLPFHRAEGGHPPGGGPGGRPT